MRLWLAASLLSLCVVASAEVYRWVDEQGNVVFSDQAGPGAEPVKLPEITTYEALPYDPEILASPPEGADGGAPPRYQVAFLQPTQNETLRDNQGNVPVALQLEPRLRKNDRIVLQLDQGARTVEVDEPAYTFTGIDRGSHTLQAWVVNAQGERVGDIAQTAFHLHQASRLFEPPPDTDGDGDGDGDGDSGDGDGGDADGPTGPVQQAPRAPMAPRFQYNPTAPNSGS